MTDATRNWWLKAAFEGVLIVLGVILGFAVNEWRAERAARNTAETTLVRIESEISANRDKLAAVVDYHREVASHLAEAGAPAGDETMMDFLIRNGERGIGDVLLNDEAWTTALSRDALGRADFDDVQAVAAVYKLTDAGVNRTWNNLAAQFQDLEAYQPEMTGPALHRLEMTFQELASQETFLIQQYDDVLARLAD